MTAALSTLSAETDPAAAYAAAAPVRACPVAAWLARWRLTVPATARSAPLPGGGAALLLPIYAAGGRLAGVWRGDVDAAGRFRREAASACAGTGLDGAAVRLGGAPVPLPGGAATKLAVTVTVLEALAASDGRWPVWAPASPDRLAGLDVPEGVGVLYVAGRGFGGAMAARSLLETVRTRHPAIVIAAIPLGAVATVFGLGATERIVR